MVKNPNKKSSKKSADKSNKKSAGASLPKFKSYKDFYHFYVHEKFSLRPYQRVGVAFLIVVISGFIGWTYEFIVGLIDHGEVYMQGGNFLPWMNIYAFGALLIIPTTYKVLKYPWAVFVVSFFTTGIVELLGGWLVYTIGNGTRYWNYCEGPWLIGNINGFVCLLSVTCFALSALLLMYVVFPLCVYAALKMKKRAFLTLAITLFTLVMLDELGNLTMKNLNLPTAMDFYRSIGLKYWEY